MASCLEQRKSWDEIKKHIIWCVNRLTSANLKLILIDFHQVNLLRGKGVIASQLLAAQVSNSAHAQLYASAIAFMSSTVPEIGELAVNRAMLRFLAGCKAKNPTRAAAYAELLAHLYTHGLISETPIMEILLMLLESPSDFTLPLIAKTLQPSAPSLDPSVLQLVLKEIHEFVTSEALPRRVQFMAERILSEKYEQQSFYPQPGFDLVPDEVKTSLSINLKDERDPKDELDVFQELEPEQYQNLEEKWKSRLIELFGEDISSIKFEKLEDYEEEFESSEEREKPRKRNKIDSRENSRSRRSHNSRRRSHREHRRGSRSRRREERENSFSSITNIKQTQGRHIQNVACNEEHMARVWGIESSIENITKKENIKCTIRDMRGTNLTTLRSRLYMQMMSSATPAESAHKLLSLDCTERERAEIANMIVDCCSQARNISDFWMKQAKELCSIREEFQKYFSNCFHTQYDTCHRLTLVSTKKLAVFFAHLIAYKSIPITVLNSITLTEEETTSSTRIFLQKLLQEMQILLGEKELFNLLDVEKGTLPGMFPKEPIENMVFAQNFYVLCKLDSLAQYMSEKVEASRSE